MNEFETSTRVENAYRNRYANILSNEDTRVKLIDVAPGDNDYINANRVTGHHGHPGYIATQAPLPETTPHFWQMVYESVSPVIIMLTREQEDHCEMSKSDQYWPGVSQDLLFNDYMVHGLDERIHEVHGVIERRFQVGKVVDKRKKHGRDLVDADSLIAPSAESSAWQTPARGRNHGHHQLCGDDDQLDCIDNEELLQHLELIGPVLEVVQLQYVDWPDQNVPTSPNTLLELCQRVEVLLGEHTARTKVSAPPIVHCSAGVGRTGTFIAVDTTLRRLWDAFAHGNEANGCDDDVVERGPQEAVHVEEIRELVRKMKNERSKMVQTAEQYRFIYHAVLAGMKKWEGGDVLFGNVGNDGLLGNGQLTDDDAVRLWHDQQSTDQKG